MDISAPLSANNNITETDEEMSASRNGSGGTASGTTIRLAFWIYCFLFAFACYEVSTTLYAYPLFPIQPESLEWSNAWLVATVFDYYGACFCFGGIVLSSESSWIKGIAWNIAFALVGSPACCFWVILRIHQQGSLRLVEKARRD